MPGTRLPRPLSGTSEYDELMANWRRLDHDSLDETEDWGSRTFQLSRDTSCGTAVFVVPWLTMRVMTQLREPDVGA